MVCQAPRLTWDWSREQDEVPSYGARIPVGVNSEGAKSSRQTTLCAREEKAGRWGRCWAGWTPRMQVSIPRARWSGARNQELCGC